MSEMIWVNVVLPIATAFIGWLGSSYRNKQKKEGDILSNVERIVAMQDSHIQKAEATLLKSEKIIQRLEAKLDRKNKSVRAANKCKYTNEGEGCPVLAQEEKNEHIYDAHCDQCEYKNSEQND